MRPDSHGSGQRASAALGSILIILGIALLGGALSVAAATQRLRSPKDTVAAADAHAAAAPTATITAAAPQAAAPSSDGPRWAPIEQLPSTPAPTVAPPTVAPPSPSPASAGAAEPTATPRPPALPPSESQPTAAPEMPPATHIQVPSVGINTSVVEVGYTVVNNNGQPLIEWQVADYAAGHHNLSANPGEGGNIVISGHGDWRGEVFRTLEYVQIGDQVILTTANGDHVYEVVEIHFRKEVGVPLGERLASGQFIAPMPEERVTLVTCWPYGIDDHRIFVVAKPVSP